MSKHRYNPEVLNFHSPDWTGMKFGRLHGSQPGYCPPASFAGVLALYPSTTTELPFT